MSIWGENEKRTDISYPHRRKYVCVEYPGKIEKDDRALLTLGGNGNLSKIYSNMSKRLPLNFRPEDIYCKPIYGDRLAVTNLLMKVKKRKRKSDGVVEHSVEILGLVETMYKFQGMCDFQYMPMTTLPNGALESIVDKVEINSMSDREEYLNRRVPLYIPPLAFSRVDRPCDFLYKQSIEHRGQYNNPDLSRPPNLIGTVRQRRSIHTIFVNYGEAIPSEPIPEAVKRLTADFVDPDGKEIIKKLLDEKPLWLKVELEHRTGYRGDKLKTFLPAMCFYWLDGPWRAQWNKFGFDPTTDVSAKIYQTVDFRIRQARPGQMVVKAKRSEFRMNQWNMTNRSQKQNVKIDLGSLGEDAKPEHQKPVTDTDKELYYKFKPDKVPPHRMMYYPVCYVEIEEVQFLAHQNDGKETKCTEKDGWCIPDFNEKAREQMYKYVNRLLHRDDSVEMRFWRSKKVKRREEMLRLEGSEEDSEGASNKSGATDITDKTDPKQTAKPDNQTDKQDTEKASGSGQHHHKGGESHDEDTTGSEYTDESEESSNERIDDDDDEEEENNAEKTSDNTEKSEPGKEAT